MEYGDLDCDTESGILIYQLPNELMRKALDVLPSDIKRTSIDESGMRVNFVRPTIHNEFIRKRFIVIDGILFNIYSTVTCLTVFGIFSYVKTEETIKNHLEGKGMPVYSLYRILKTSNYRIILNVPEVLANFDMSPISLDPDCKTVFPIAFYCRVCRGAGHKQYQCQQSIMEKRGADDTGNKSGETSSNYARNSTQGNAVSPSVSGGRIKRTPRSTSSSVREKDLPVDMPSTSNTPTAAERLTGINRNTTTESNKVADKTTRKGAVRSVKKTKKNINSEYPCKEIFKVIMKVKGILSPEELCAFLEEVHGKKNVISYARKFTPRIPELISQIRSVISICIEQNIPDCGRSIAKKQFKIIESLCKRLDSQFNDNLRC